MLTSWHTTECVCFLYLNISDLEWLIQIFCGFLNLPIPPVCFQYHSICDLAMAMFSQFLFYWILANWPPVQKCHLSSWVSVWPTCHRHKWKTPMDIHARFCERVVEMLCTVQIKGTFKEWFSWLSRNHFAHLCQTSEKLGATQDKEWFHCWRRFVAF